MYNQGQWPGHGQVETTDIFQEIVENMPALPFGKLVNSTKTAFGKLSVAIKGDATLAQREDPITPQVGKQTT